MLPLWSEEVEARLQEQAYSLDKLDLPDEVIFCKKCVISNQRPRITIDEEGVCSACRFAEKKKNEIDWDARDHELRNLLTAHMGSSHYDCVVPCSGGKDSSYTAYVLKHEYGMNPLCVKWAPFMYTDIGRQNFENFSASGYDTIEVRPNGLIHRKLARLSLEYLGEPFQPFIFGQLSVPMRIAQQFGIKLVFFGENGEAEYGGDQSANDKPCWDQGDWDRIYQKNTGVNTLLTIGADLGCFTVDEINNASKFYKPPVNCDAEFHWLSYYKFWHPQQNFYTAQEHCGFEPNPDGRSEGTYQKYASIDDKLDGLHYYFAWLKFGLGRCTGDAAHEVRDGDITREEAVALVQRYDAEVPLKYYQECCEYLGMTDKHFWHVVERYQSEKTMPAVQNVEA